MAGIIGLTDSAQLRHDGKIRGGTRDEKTGFPKNSPHFLLHEVPELEKVLGEKPTEIYFTVLSDHPDYFFHPDLRWYAKTELVCKSMHNHVDPQTQMPMGSVAAFFRPGTDVQGLTADKFPGMRAFRRNCAYKACPDYIQKGRCGEHLTLDIIIPQYSMGHIFRYEGTSINAILDVQSTLQKAWIKYDGKLAGNIFKLQKVKAFVNFPDDKGGSSRRETDLVSLENVNFAEYEEKFKSKIDPGDWAALMRIQNHSSEIFFNSRAVAPMAITGDADVAKAQSTLAALPESPLQKSATETSEEAITKRANDPVVAPLFAEIALLLGMENSLENRFNTAKAKPDVQGLYDYLNKRIKDIKKKAKADKAPAKDNVAPPAAKAPPAPSTAPKGEVLDGPPLY